MAGGLPRTDVPTGRKAELAEEFKPVSFTFGSHTVVVSPLDFNVDDSDKITTIIGKLRAGNSMLKHYPPGMKKDEKGEPTDTPERFEDWFYRIPSFAEGPDKEFREDEEFNDYLARILKPSALYQRAFEALNGLLAVKDRELVSWENFKVANWRQAQEFVFQALAKAGVSAKSSTLKANQDRIREEQEVVVSMGFVEAYVEEEYLFHSMIPNLHMLCDAYGWEFDTFYYRTPPLIIRNLIELINYRITRGGFLGTTEVMLARQRRI